MRWWFNLANRSGNEDSELFKVDFKRHSGEENPRKPMSVTECSLEHMRSVYTRNFAFTFILLFASHFTCNRIFDNKINAGQGLILSTVINWMMKNDR